MKCAIEVRNRELANKQANEHAASISERADKKDALMKTVLNHCGRWWMIEWPRCESGTIVKFRKGVISLLLFQASMECCGDRGC